MASRSLISAAIALPLALSGCKNRTTEPPAAAAEARDGGALPAEAPLPVTTSWTRLAGTLDVTNRYASTVTVETRAPMEAGVDGQCSGVVIGPHLVLTAGHCVCTKHRVATPGDEGRRAIDGSACAGKPTVTTVTYDAPTKGSVRMPASMSQDYEAAEVRPHPEFRVILDEQGRIVAARADLAVVLLKEPVGNAALAPSVADTDVQAGETFVMVGYTYDKIVGGISGQRRFTPYKVQRLLAPDDDRALFEQPERDLYIGDSGGPCLREGTNGAELVGVSSGGIGERPTFTRTYPYRTWLTSELERASSLMDAGNTNQERRHSP